MVLYRKVLIAYNGAAESRIALEEAARFAADPEVELHLAAVMNTAAYLVAGEYVPEITLAAGREELEDDVRKVQADLEGRGIKVTTHLVMGEPVDVIARLVDSLRINLLVVGHSRSKSFAMRWWRGSTDRVLVERVRCSVLIAADVPR